MESGKVKGESGKVKVESGEVKGFRADVFMCLRWELPWPAVIPSKRGKGEIRLIEVCVRQRIL